jgi:hypothetical protein
MITRRKSTPDHDRLLGDERADPVDRVEAMRCIAADRLMHLEPQVAELLEHANDMLREQAISTLVMQWQLANYVPVALRMLTGDPSPSARGRAANVLAEFVRYTALEKDTIVAALIHALKNDPHEYVYTDAYHGLVRILAPERKSSTLPDPIDRERDIDWTLLAPYSAR